MPRTTVFLDWGGTLAHVPEELPDPPGVWGQVLATFGEPRSGDAIRAAIGAADRDVGRRVYSYLGRTEEFWEIFDGRVMDALGVGSRRAEVGAAVQRIFGDPTRIRLYPETRRTLLELRSRGYHTGIISNHHDGLLRDLHQLEVDPLFDTVTYSQEAGAEKPEPVIFSAAVRRAGCAPSEAVHVGDAIGADIEGARRSGIAAIWVNRLRRTESPGCPTISTLDELLAVLERMS